MSQSGEVEVVSSSVPCFVLVKKGVNIFRSRPTLPKSKTHRTKHKVHESLKWLQQVCHLASYAMTVWYFWSICCYIAPRSHVLSNLVSTVSILSIPYEVTTRVTVQYIGSLNSAIRKSKLSYNNTIVFACSVGLDWDVSHMSNSVDTRGRGVCQKSECVLVQDDRTPATTPFNNRKSLQSVSCLPTQQ